MNKNALPLTIIICLILISITLSEGFSGDTTYDWPRWRGPNGDGISLETNWNPEALAGGPKILWKANVELGSSNVVIKGKYLYVIGNNFSGDDIVFCLHVETGKEVWRSSYPCGMGASGYGPQTTPTVDGKYVYTLSVEGQLFCFNAKNGKVHWEKDLVSEYDVKVPFYGFAGSPIIEGYLLILTANMSGLALEKKTGEKVWISDAPPENLVLANSTGTHYAVPVIYGYEGKRYAMISSYEGLHLVEVETGKVLWLYEWKSMRSAHVADPLFFNNKVFITQYFEEHGCVLLNIGREEPKVLWENKSGDIQL